MSLTRYEDNSLVNNQHYMDTTLPRRVEEFARSSMCPKAFQGKPGDIAVIGHSLATLGVELSLGVLKQCYVVHGSPGFMAQLQASLADRHGVRIVPLDEESDGRSATCKILGKDDEWHRVTVTWAEAEQAGWVKQNPNYKSIPDRMLMARAVTKAVDRHAPEAKLFMPAVFADAAPTPPITAQVHDTPQVETGEAATERERRRFRNLVAGLSEDDKQAVRDHIKAEGIPPIGHPDLTSAQAARLEEIVYEVEDQRAAATAEDPDDDVAEGEVVEDVAPEQVTFDGSNADQEPFEWADGEEPF